MTGRTRSSRRRFLETAAVVGAAEIVPVSALARSATETGKRSGRKPPSERLRLGFIGAGGQAWASIDACIDAGHVVHALCDVDEARAKKAFRKYSKARKYADWRKMLDREWKNLDGVVVATPDHVHAVATLAAMRRGLPVYCEKPLTRTISEARAVAEYAKAHRIVTQMGNHGHATEGARLTNEWIRSGVLGAVTEIHCWTDRPIWPQGVVRPPAQRPPRTMKWDLWLGPAPEKGYSPEIAPFNWRAYWDYGSGALGDMAAHIVDHPYWALELGAPEWVEAEFARENPKSAKDTYPRSSVVTYSFAAKGDRPPVILKWFDGANRPPFPKGMKESRNPWRGMGGVVYYGTKRNMIHSSHGGVPRIFPEREMRKVQEQGLLPPKTMPRSPGHKEEWYRAIMANDYEGSLSRFAYSGPLTETILLGSLAIRAGAGERLVWDPEAMTTGNEQADAFVRARYRDGWAS